MFQKMFLKLTRARRFRSGMIAICAIGVIVFLATGVSPLLALGTVTMRVDPATRAAPVNGTFTVDIVTDLGTEMDPNGLGAYEFDLVYNKDYLEVVTDGVTDAGELGATGRSVAELGPSVDNENGRTTFAVYSHPPEDVDGPGGTVVLATVTLRAMRAGMTTLNLENARLTDTQANVWPDGGAGHALSIESGVLVLDTFGDEVGVWRDGTWYLDYNGNWSWNGPIVDVYSTAFGLATDMPLVGDWNVDGGDEVGVWRNGTWYLDYNGNWSWDGPIIDVYSTAFGLATDMPLVGDWNGDGGDEVGVWRNGTWYLDYNGNWSWDGPIIDVYSTAFGLATDMPLVGDWNEDGRVEVGVWRNGTWYLDYNGNWSWDGPIIDVYSTAFGLATDMPLVGDWNGGVE